MGVVYVGIDEAGYGPMLGPLTVAMTAFRSRDHDPSDGVPDLWKSLRRSVCRETSDHSGRIAIDDSKKLKLPNTSKKRHPLTHLERGVLAFLGADGPADDAALMATVGAELDAAPWYAGEPTHIPLGADARMLELDRASLARAMEAAGIEFLGARCVALCEGGFNRRLSSARSKAAVSGAVVAELVSEAIKRWGGLGDCLRVAVDRQSGRAHYDDLIGLVSPKPTIVRRAIVEWSSRYAIELPGDMDIDAAIAFEVEAEQRHLPVALASMTAKLVRELAMLRFNRYWRTRLPELKPTAGYYGDARRWLEDARPVLTEEVRRALVRQA